jgi:hypothetical protein
MTVGIMSLVTVNLHGRPVRHRAAAFAICFAYFLFGYRLLDGSLMLAGCSARTRGKPADGVVWSFIASPR